MLRLALPFLIISLELAHACGSAFPRAAIPAQVTLEGTQVRLTTPKPHHYPALHRLLNAPESVRYQPPAPRIETVESVAALYEFLARMQAEGEWLELVVEDVKSGNLVGRVAFHTFDFAVGSAKRSIMIDKAYWGTGVSTEAHRLLVDFAFETLGLSQIHFETSWRNMRARGLLAKLGVPFSHRRFRWMNGSLYWICVHTLTRENWAALKR